MGQERRLENLVKRHNLYGDFLEFSKRTSTRQLAIGSLLDRFLKLETLRSRYGFSLENPNPTETLRRVEKAGCAAQTINGYRFIIRQWLRFRGIEDEDWADELKHKSGPRVRQIHPKDLLTLEDREHVLSCIQSPGTRGFLAALWDTGARPSELALMNVVDVKEDKNGFVLNVHQTKYEAKPRSVRMLDPRSMAVFSDWWRIHPRKDEPDAPAFINRQGNRIRIHTVTRYLQLRFNEELGRGERKPRSSLNLYLYRKSRITHLLKEEIMKPHQIKMRVGHKKESTVLEKFYAIIDEMDQADVELQYLGVRSEADVATRSEPCPQCGAPNLSTASRCFRCRRPLTEQAVVDEVEIAVDALVEALIRSPERLQRLIDAANAQDASVDLDHLREKAQEELQR